MPLSLLPASLAKGFDMDHAITLGNVVTFVLAVGGIVGLCAILLVIIDLMNPFRSGH